MTTVETSQELLSSKAPLENPNARIVVIGQVLCVIVPVLVWFAPLPLEPVTQHGFAIVGFMVVAWITRAMDYALAGLVGGFLFWSLGRARFPAAVSGLSHHPPLVL